MTEAGQWLTAKQVAASLGLYEKTVRLMAARGEIPAVRMSPTPRGRLRFPPDAVARWQASAARVNQ